MLRKASTELNKFCRISAKYNSEFHSDGAAAKDDETMEAVVFAAHGLAGASWTAANPEEAARFTADANRALLRIASREPVVRERRGGFGGGGVVEVVAALQGPVVARVPGGKAAGGGGGEQSEGGEGEEGEFGEHVCGVGAVGGVVRGSEWWVVSGG